MPPRSSVKCRSAFAALTALAGMAAAGALLLPWAAHLGRQELAAGLQYPPPPIERTDALSQQLSLFSMGGLRTFAAEILAMDATSAWLQQDWPRARSRWQQITTLCPHRANYWIRASRDMAKNAVAHTQTREDLGEYERAVLRKDYLDTAEDFLRRGIANNPEEALLRLELAGFYEDLARRPQFAKAAEAYREAVEHGASPMYWRWVFYNRCRIRGQEQDAWQLGRALFEQERHRSPSLRCLLFVLQAELGDAVPAAERLTPEQLFGSRKKAADYLRTFLRNDLRFPTRGIREYLEQHA